jgi:CMP/dCMP kinase
MCSDDDHLDAGRRETLELIDRMRAITISREYGSGGGEIAARLAARLDWRLVDHNIVSQVAAALHESEAAAAARDERVASFVVHLVDSMQWIAPLAGLDPGLMAEEDEHRHFEALERVVRSAIAIGHVVLVGRGAQALLRNRRDTLRLRVIAPLEQRIAYVAQREDLNSEAARARILHKDQDRARFLQTFHHLRADDPHLYDVVINTGVLSLDSAVDLAVAALDGKAQRLQTPESDLGPGRGLRSYPVRPSGQTIRSNDTSRVVDAQSRELD